ILVGREKSKKLVEAMAGRPDPVIGVLAQRTPEQEDPGLDELSSVGVTGRLMKVTRVNENNLQLIIQGERRFKVLGPGSVEPYLTARVQLIEETIADDFEIEALSRSVKNLAVALIDLRGDLPSEL